MTDPGEPPDEYTDIDDALERWGAKNGVKWERLYKGYNVRSVSWGPVQLWVDPPSSGEAAVHVAVNSSSAAIRKTHRTAYRLDELERGLDDALNLAREWRKVR